MKTEAPINEYFSAKLDTTPPIIGPSICPNDVKVDPMPCMEPCDLLSADFDRKVCVSGPTNELNKAIKIRTEIKNM